MSHALTNLCQINKKSVPVCGCISKSNFMTQIIGIRLEDGDITSAAMCRWHAIAAWHWDVHEDSCGICRMQFDTYCVDCKKPGDECPPSAFIFPSRISCKRKAIRKRLSNPLSPSPPVWGKCNHIFHLHCILKWIQQQGAEAHCPMCRQPWEFK